MIGHYDPNSAAAKAIYSAAAKYVREDQEVFAYGTAGFRMKEFKLDAVMFAMGILAALRSKKVQEETVGVMITASHNRYQDNGVKLVDPRGDMLEESWEKYATRIANARTPDEFRDAYARLLVDGGIDSDKKARVILGRDTRPSGVRLSQAVIEGAEAAGATIIDYGILTTPQLHYLVRATNTQGTSASYGEVSEQGYYKKLAAAFREALDDAKPLGLVTVDCANGVGAPKLKELLKHLPSGGEHDLKIRVVNDNIDQPEKLNEKVGADYVKTEESVPAHGFDGQSFDRWASFDGDADRIVYYFNSDGPVFNILDGDRIAILAASFIGDLIQKSGLSEKIKVSVVQTAYANGASTAYIEQVLKLKVECTSTGVKHLHHAAARADCGVYFEANGHGTVLFSSGTLKRIHNHAPESPAQADALKILIALTNLINQTVGDSISDLLLVEVVLGHKGWTVREWLATYSDMPTKLAKARVPDRGAYATVEGSAERKLQNPPGFQTQIDRVVAKYKDGRCFVRPSGTEDVVRVFGEARERFDVEDMVGRVLGLIETQSTGQGQGKAV